MNSLEKPDSRPLNRSTPLARELVHRTALAEVLLTDVRQDREHVFTAAAQWTRSHPTFDRTGDGRHNPLIVAETMRELGICIPLLFYAVAADSRFLIEELQFDLEPDAEPRARYGGTEITCEVRTEPMVTGQRRPEAHGPNGREGADNRDGGTATAPPQQLRLSVRYLAEGREFAQAKGIARFLAPTAYAAVRSRRRPTHDASSENLQATTPDPAKVGVLNQPDLLIGLDSEGRTLILPADPYHPFFFDHFSDHVPGMVLIEAARQAAVRQAGQPGWRVIGCTLRALCFTELDPPAEIVCTIDGTAARSVAGSVTGPVTGPVAEPVAEFEVRQFGNPTATGTLRFQTSSPRESTAGLASQLRLTERPK
jgi:2-oxo-3-(phosphooxy)propyl 3-oxoalkanoate synthase